jgi:hypothetical protein
VARCPFEGTWSHLRTIVAITSPYCVASRAGHGELLRIYPSKLSEKGSEQRSEDGFGRHKEGEMGRKEPPRWLGGLRYGCPRGFSDIFFHALR